MSVLRCIFQFIYYFFVWITSRFFRINQRKRYYRNSPKSDIAIVIPCKRRKKPEWVVKEIIRLSAYLPNYGCQKIADTFNRLHGEKQQMTVCKSTVYNYRIKHLHDIYLLRKKIKQRKPRSYSKNRIWSTDLTTVTDELKQQHRVLGIMDNRTRACLLLDEAITKSSINLLRHLLNAVEKYGKPHYLRMDNEPVFKSKVFRFGLWILRIKPQYSEVACPWQNGRIERLFGTFKFHIRKIAITGNELNQRLIEFRYFYNHVRTHNNLAGKTPAEVWNNQPHNKIGKTEFIDLWNGVLAGFYVPPD